MEPINDKKLLRFIRILPVLIISLATLMIIGIMFHDNRVESEENLQSLRSDVLAQQKIRIQQEVDSVYQQLTYEKQQTEKDLKIQIKQRVYEAYDIAQAIYRENPDKSDAEISKQITTALRDIRFNDGRGYFFIYKMDGTNVLLPHLPHMEGSDRWEMLDSRSAPIIQDLASIVDNSNEGYHRWWFYKPQDLINDHDKIGFVKKFEPLNWFIGTGEYVVDFEKDVQKRLLAWISEIRYGNSGYIFVIESDGNIIAHQDQNLRGFQGIDLKDENNIYYIKEMLDIAQLGGGFARYNSIFKPPNVERADKMSYVRWFDKWQWTIGTGFYISEFDAYFAEKKQVILKQNREELIKLVLFSFLLASVMSFFAAFLSGKVSSRFRNFQAKINHDFTELSKTKDKMQHLALYDSLTDLPNRIQFNHTVKLQIIESDDKGSSLAIILIGLDGFKKINDQYGHATGDKLLAILSRKFELILDKEDTVSRFGGDEFIFCLPNVGTRSEIEERVSLIQEIFLDRIPVEQKKFHISATIGVATYPYDGVSAEELITSADIALYKAKSNGNGTVVYFDSTLAAKLEYDFLMEEQLRGALKRNEISVVYQPQISIGSEKVVGVEALCRWKNAKLGQVSPEEFISVAEDIDVIHDIGQFVLKTACTDVLSYSPNGDNAIKLSVNISPSQLKLLNFADDFYSAVIDSSIDVERITIEITENVLLEDQESALPILQELRHLGFGISLDDFGTGFSSLSYLNNLPVTEIKVDRTFVDKMLVNEQSDSLIKAILAIGQTCDMVVVAEGVEEAAQYQRLKEYECTLVQGYYFYKPMEIQKLLLVSK